MQYVIDLGILGLVAGITYALMSEGLWGASLMFFNALFAALIAFNFYEPLAAMLVGATGPESFLASYADSVIMMVLYVVSLLLLRLTTESVAPSMVRFPTPVYHVGRVAFGFGAAAITIAMLILAYQASPVQKKMLGVMDYKYEPFYKLRFDRDFLAFFQYSTGYTFARNGAGPADPRGEFRGRPVLFDPNARWLLDHQQARPIGTEDILEDAPAGDSSASPAPSPGGEAAPAPGAAGAPGPGIPGGTAGAAAGLAPTNL